MIKEAEVVQKSIGTLLDHKQKQANTMEAKSTRKQAQDTAKQTDTIVIFTVVTIVFVSHLTPLGSLIHSPGQPLTIYFIFATATPLFLTSLFALNISQYLPPPG
jgi:hypothetical protein